MENERRLTAIILAQSHSYTPVHVNMLDNRCLEISQGSWNIYNGRYKGAYIHAYDSTMTSMELSLADMARCVNGEDVLPTNISIYCSGHVAVEFRMRADSWFGLALADCVWIPINRDQFMNVLRHVVNNI